MRRREHASRSEILPTALRGLLLGGLALVFVPTAAAHEGSAHAGLPHWALLGLVAVGVAVTAASVHLGRTRWVTAPRRTITGVLAGVVVVMVGTVGLVEIQVEPVGTTSNAHRWYPLFTGVAGFVVASASLVVGRLRWPDRPRYAALGLVLASWIMYPVLLPGPAYNHPVGYLIVLSVPLLVGYVLWTDLGSVLGRGVLDRLSRRVGAAVTALFAAFFMFSAGLLSVNPDGVSPEDGGFVAIESFANPLVIWPAVEFYVPAVPLGGAVSVGTGIVAGLLAGLVGLNTAFVTTVWQRNVEVASSDGAVGAVATVGATTCTCCGPAIYAVASAGLGASASPLYWAFIDPLSPVGALFLATAIVLLTGSAVRFGSRLESVGVRDLPES